MGGFDPYRNFLLYLFRACFSSTLPLGKEFCISMVDLMEYLYPAAAAQKMGMTKTGFLKEHFDLAYVTKKIDEAVAYHINYDNLPENPIITRTTVFMLDTVHQVPRNKSTTQKSRDSTELTHMNKKSFHEMQSLSSLKRPDNLFFIDSHQQTKYPFEGNTVWRSVNLKLQLYRIVTHHVLHARIKPSTVLVMDDGLAFSIADYERVRKNIEYDLQLQDRDEFEKEFIINQILTHSKDFITRFMVYDDAVFWRPCSTGVGEADIKILNYIKRDIGLKKFLVVNQDTDVIFILLLHMKHFLKGDESDDEYEIWLDTRSPNFSQSIKEYRFINIILLYKSIVKFFSDEFPLVKQPIETFCFLVFSLKTDFTMKFSPSLQINPAFLWNWFSQLHSNKPDYIPFNEKTGPIKRVPCSKHKLEGLLNSAVQYDMIKRRYVLKHQSIARFYYFLCQMKLMDLRKEIGLSNGYYDYGKDVVVGWEELLIYGKEVQERLILFKQFQLEKEEEGERFFQTLKRPSSGEEKEGEKRLKPSSGILKKISISISERDDDEPSPFNKEVSVSTKPALAGHMKNYMNKYAKKLQQMSKRESTNEYYGILNENDMFCRIYRIEWYLSYCTDGWRNLLDCTERAKHDPSLSQWGWKERLVEGEEEYQRVMNSSYYKAHYNPEHPHLYTLSEILECNQVSHKRLYY